MPRSVLSRFLLGLVPAWLCAATLTSAAPTAKSESKADKAATPVETIRKTLDLTVSVDFQQGISLPAALQQLSDEHKVSIVLDRTVFQVMGVEPAEMSVEFKAKNVKLRTALRNFLNPFNLSFGIVGDTVLVSTEDNIVYRQLKQRVSVDLDNVPLNKALKDLSGSSGVNLVVDPRSYKTKVAESPVTLQVDDVPLETAVRLMAEIAGMRPVRMGNVLFVTSEERAEKLKDTDSLVPNPGLPAIGPGVVGPGGFPGVPPGGAIGGAALPALPPQVPGNPAPPAPGEAVPVPPKEVEKPGEVEPSPPKNP